MAMRWTVKHWISLFVAAAWAITSAPAQTFSSGSTGADGALNLASGTTTVQLPASGVLNYTTVNVTASATLYFAPNATNTPVTILATGAVTINGEISVSATISGAFYAVNVPGPGGYYGGALGQSGLGPGGGQYGKTDGTQNGKWVGPLDLVPIVGGSGGAALAANCYNYNGNGGAGGGAILIASSTSISVPGSIYASGNSSGCGTPGGSGADGAIRLVSNLVNVSGSLHAAVVRLEAPAGGLIYTGTGTPPVTAPINPVIVPTNPPTVAITSIGGYQAPSATGASWRTVDLLLPTQLQDPITVVVQGSNVPAGSQVTLMFSGSAATASPATATLVGTTASSSATFSVSGLNRGAVTVLFAVVTFNPTLLGANMKQSGPDAVEKVALAAALGRPTKYRFLRKNGSEVSSASLSPDLKRIFGY